MLMKGALLFLSTSTQNVVSSTILVFVGNIICIPRDQEPVRKRHLFGGSIKSSGQLQDREASL